MVSIFMMYWLIVIIFTSVLCDILFINFHCVISRAFSTFLVSSGDMVTNLTS